MDEMFLLRKKRVYYRRFAYFGWGRHPYMSMVHIGVNSCYCYCVMVDLQMDWEETRDANPTRVFSPYLSHFHFHSFILFCSLQLIYMKGYSHFFSLCFTFFFSSCLITLEAKHLCPDNPIILLHIGLPFSWNRVLCLPINAVVHHIPIMQEGKERQHLSLPCCSPSNGKEGNQFSLSLSWTN